MRLMVRFPSCRILILFSMSVVPLAAECSDSGFCRLPVTPKNGTADEPAALPNPTSAWSTGLRLSYAKGDSEESLRYTTLEPSVRWSPTATTQVSASLPLIYSSGRAGSTKGIGDVLLSGSQGLSPSWSIAVGLRLPTGDDAALDGAGLGYQPGLGTTDLLGALVWQQQGFDVRAGYIASLGTNGTPGIELRRGDDLAAGVGYSPVYGQWEGRIGLLGLLRLQDSQSTASGTAVTIPESAGAQVNLQLEAGWRPQSNLLISVEIASALMSREKNARVDGLTRSSSVSLGTTLWW